MANPIPTLMVVNYKGSGNVSVHKLLTGISLDPMQDGNDVLVGNLETPSATLENNHGNRLIEAFGKRFLLHGFRVYERNEGGDGIWGEVTGLGLSINDTAHSGLHLLHPNGIPTLAFLCETDNTFMHVVHTTDGVNWTDTTTSLSVLTVSEAGPSIVYRNSIFWLADSNDGIEVRQYDFVLANATEHDLPSADNKNGFCFHVHQGVLFVAGPEITSEDDSIWRLDGTVFTRLELVIANFNSGSVYGMWSDGDDLIVVHQATSSGGFGNHRARRAGGVLLGGSFTSVSANVILTGIYNGTTAGFIPFVSIDPDPSTGQQRVYFWHRTGNLNSGNFDLYRFEYRQLPTGVHTGAFQVGEQVTDGSATGIVTDIVVDTSLSLTDVKGTWGAGPVTGADSSATATSSGGLAETVVTSLGAGVLASNFGLPNVTNGGLDRIPAKGAARPAWDGLPTEVPNARRHFFRVYGTGSTINLKLYYSTVEEAPDAEGTLGGVAVSSGSPPTTPTFNVGLNRIENLTPDDGATLYYVDHNATADGIAAGQRYTLTWDID